MFLSGDLATLHAGWHPAEVGDGGSMWGRWGYKSQLALSVLLRTLWGLHLLPAAGGAQ